MTTTPYVPDYLRVEVPPGLNSADRAKFWKRRGPLGDAEFYSQVCPDVPALLDFELCELMAEMRARFDAGKPLSRYHTQVRDWLRRYRLSRVPRLERRAA
jgi:hypothetical protein